MISPFVRVKVDARLVPERTQGAGELFLADRVERAVERKEARVAGEKRAVQRKRFLGRAFKCGRRGGGGLESGRGGCRLRFPGRSGSGRDWGAPPGIAGRAGRRGDFGRFGRLIQIGFAHFRPGRFTCILGGGLRLRFRAFSTRLSSFHAVQAGSSLVRAPVQAGSVQAGSSFATGS